MFKEYEELSKEFIKLTTNLKKEQEELIEVSKNKEITEDEIINMDRKIFLKYKDDLYRIKEYIVNHYGEKMFFEFCQSVNWTVHNGSYQWLDNIGAIDTSIVHLIIKLNELGFQTKFSCSGIKSEHKEDPVSGYIMFVNFTKQHLNKLKKISFKNQFYVLMKEKVEYEGLKILNREQQLIIYNEAEDDEQKLLKWKNFFDDLSNSN